MYLFNDLSGLEPPGFFQVFAKGCTTGEFQMWHKPKYATLVDIIIIGAGAGGGGGKTGAAGTARGGGGGGGSGAMCRFIIPAKLLPDLLYVQPGIGGAGAAADGTGTSGGNSYVALAPNISTQNLLQKSGGTAAVGGSPGTAATGGAGGAGETTTNFTFGAPWASLCNGIAVAGQTGGTGGAHTGAAGTAITWATGSLIISSGAGGGGTPTGNTDYAGGDITGGGLILPTVPGGLAAAGAGNPGVITWRPQFMSSGGSGGGTAGASGTAGRGGDGGPGSGGGGGGGVTGGAGGRGGDGMVIIACA